MTRRQAEGDRRVVLITGSELRHRFVRKVIGVSAGVSLLRSYCEGAEASLKRAVEQAAETENDLRVRHLRMREASEQDFFAPFDALTPDAGEIRALSKGEINQPHYAAEIGELDPDLLASYGCGLIREPLLSRFEGCFLNVHLGLSPYYRGGGTNFWPLVDGRPEFVGATFMHIDAGVDTGLIVHQIRARVFEGDTPHSIGNRLIADMALVYAAVLARFDDLSPLVQPEEPPDAKVFRRRDFSDAAVERVYENFRGGLVSRYLDEADNRRAAAPILENPAIPALAELLKTAS